MRGAAYDGPNARVWFEHHRAVDLIMPSPDPSIQNTPVKACATLNSLWDRGKQTAVLSGTYTNLTQNTAMSNHLLSIGNKRLAESNPLDPVWGSGLCADNPRVNHPFKGRAKHLLGEVPSAVQFANVRLGRHTQPPLVELALAPRM